MSEMKPCPFCGVNNWQYQAYYSGTTVYQCGECGTIVDAGTIVDESAINTRPIEDALTARIAELETKIRHNALWQASEDAEERAHLEKLVLDLKKRIAELKGFIGQLIEAGDAMGNAQSMWVAEEDKWDALVKDWKEREE